MAFHGACLFEISLYGLRLFARCNGQRLCHPVKVVFAAPCLADQAKQPVFAAGNRSLVPDPALKFGGHLMRQAFVDTPRRLLIAVLVQDEAFRRSPVLRRKAQLRQYDTVEEQVSASGKMSSRF